MKIKAGTICFISIRGHNGFYYPIYNLGGMTEIEKDIENPTLKSWICSRKNLVAVEVVPEEVKDLYGNSTYKTVVWVDKRYIDK